MKAAFVTGIEKVEIKEIDKPVISDTEVLIKTKTVGVCGSDLHLFRGTHPFRHAPAILGHEIAGDVVEIGSKVTNIKVGDRVTVEPQVGCGECEMCKRGLVSLCSGKKVPGTPEWIGAFSEYFNADEKTVYKLADQTSYEMGTLAEPLAVAVHTVNHAETRTGGLVILGAGTIGQLILAVARKRGYSPIIVTDTAAFNREFAVKHGADAALDPVTENIPEKVKEMTGGRGADLAIIAAGADNILDQACECVHKCGEIGIVAMITNKIPFYCYSVVFSELKIYGAMCYESGDFAEAMEMINTDLELTDYVTQEMDGIEKTQEGLDILSRKKEDVVKVLIKIGD